MFLLLFISFLSFNACSSRIGDFTVISTRNSNIKNWKRYPGRVEGSSCKLWLFFLPIKDWDLKDAIEDAVETSNEDLKKTGVQSESLVDAKLSTGWGTIFLMTWSCLYAEGTPADSWYKTEEREKQVESATEEK